MKQNLIASLGRLISQKLKREGPAKVVELIAALVNCSPVPRAEHEQLSKLVSEGECEDDVWEQVFKLDEVSQCIEVNADELAAKAVGNICQASSAIERLKAVRVLHVLSPHIAPSLLVTLQVLVPLLSS